MLNTRSRCRHRAGYTLIEIMMVIAMLVVFMSSLGVALFSTEDAFQSAQHADDLQSRVDRAASRAADEILSTGLGGIAPDPNTDWGTSTFDFRRVTGLLAGAVVWGNLNRIEFQYETGELDDGIDNNGNGLVDEGQLILTRDVGLASERSVVLCSGVSELGEGEVLNGIDDNGNGVRDELGFNVHRVGDVLTVRLTLGKIGEGNRLMERSIGASVRLRN